MKQGKDLFCFHLIHISPKGESANGHHGEIVTNPPPETPKPKAFHYFLEIKRPLFVAAIPLLQARFHQASKYVGMSVEYVRQVGKGLPTLRAVAATMVVIQRKLVVARVRGCIEQREEVNLLAAAVGARA